MLYTTSVLKTFSKFTEKTPDFLTKLQLQDKHLSRDADFKKQVKMFLFGRLYHQAHTKWKEITNDEQIIGTFLGRASIEIEDLANTYLINYHSQKNYCKLYFLRHCKYERKKIS